jgi:hypothetical protein
VSYASFISVLAWFPFRFQHFLKTSIFHKVSRGCHKVAAEVQDAMGMDDVGDVNNSPLPCMLSSLSSRSSNRSS